MVSTGGENTFQLVELDEIVELNKARDHWFDDFEDKNFSIDNSTKSHPEGASSLWQDNTKGHPEGVSSLWQDSTKGHPEGVSSLWQDILDDENLFRPIDVKDVLDLDQTKTIAMPKSLSTQTISDQHKNMIKLTAKTNPPSMVSPKILSHRKASNALNLTTKIGIGSIHCFGTILFRVRNEGWECLLVRYWNGYDGFPKGVRTKGMTARTTALHETELSVGLHDYQYQLLGPMVIENNFTSAVGYFVGVLKDHSQDANLTWSPAEFENVRWRRYNDTITLKSIPPQRAAALTQALKLAQNILL
jgi:hypothetical protein